MTLSPTPVTGRQVLYGAALLTVSVLAGLGSLQPVIQPGPWGGASAAVVVVVALVTVLTRRREPRSPYAPTLWGSLAGLLVLAALYGGSTSGLSVPMPTPDTLDRLLRLAHSGTTAIAEGTIPLEPVRGVELLVSAGAVLVFLVADLLALGLGRAASSGVAVAGLWVPVALFELAAPIPAVLAGGAAFLLLLAMTRPTPSRGGARAGHDVRPAIVAAVAVTAVAVAAGPLVSATPVFGSVRLPSTWSTGPAVGPLHLSDDLDMRQSLPDQSGRPILTYTTDDADIGPLRMFTMVDFDGRQWDRGDLGGPVVDAEGILWPTQPGALLEGGPVVEIQVGELDQDRLPIPIEPRDVQIDGAWRYDSGRDEMVSVGASTRGATYRVAIYPRDLSPEALRQDGRAADIDPASPLLAVPDTPFVADIRALAAEVTADAATQYDQAVALQTYFRSLATFRYDTQVPPPETEDAVWDFLNQRVGYCVQFATAMTVMARTLGIPARMAVGFLPGQPTSQGPTTFVVSGRQAHTWPELYFQDTGWVRFEPTPASQTGPPPVYADPFADSSFQPEDQVPGEAVAPSTSVAPSAPVPQSGTVGGGLGGSADVPVPAVVAGTLLLLIAGALTVWALRRRRAPHLPQGPEEWWTVLRERLTASDVTWSDAATPRQAAELIRDRYPADGAEPEELALARRGLSGLVGAVENARYSPTPHSWETAELEAWVDAAVRPLEVTTSAQGLVDAVSGKNDARR
jgi:transglutaminase-like putative cysteine protease